MKKRQLKKKLAELTEENAALKKRNEQLVTEFMEKSAEAVEAKEEAMRTRLEVEIHRMHTGHNVCWLNDERLWQAVLKDGKSAYPHSTLPTEEELLKGCNAYIRSRFKGVCEERCELLKKPGGNN